MKANFKLDDVKKAEPFKAPEGYFDDLPLKIQHRLTVVKKPASVFSGVSWQLRWSVSGLAVLLVLCLGYLYWPVNTDSMLLPDPLDAVATADLIYYLEAEPMESDELMKVFGSFTPDDSLWNEYEDEIIPETDLSESELLLLYEDLSETPEIL